MQIRCALANAARQLRLFSRPRQQEHFKSRSPLKQNNAVVVRVTTRQSAVDELRRLVDSFGLLRGVVVPEELTDEPIEGLPYVEYLYRWHTAGYSLFKKL